MARERTGFIVSQVCATVEYTDVDGRHHKITKAAKAQTADSKNNLKDAEKQALKKKHAEQIIRDTITELKQRGATQCKGSTETRHFARVGYTDDQGKRRDVVRAAETRTHARDLIKEILRNLEEHGAQAFDADRMTFADLATHYETHYLIEAQYVDGRKVAGVRSLKPALGAVNTLKQHFGRHKLRSITYGGLCKYKSDRLETPTRSGGQRAIASVQRELAKLRRMLNIAQREGWIRKNPFAAGEPLISMADERKRERILTREEERRLLEACADPRRVHLRPIIIAAIDTGMRKGELLSLRWRDVDLEHGVIVIQAFNTKTMKQRELAMTTRLKLELARVFEESTQDPAARIFGILDNVKRSFTSARKAAGLLDVRFHDLRHTSASRLVGAHIPLSEVGRVLGHTQANTTFRYVNMNVETAKRAAAALDAFNVESEVVPAPESAMLN